MMDRPGSYLLFVNVNEPHTVAIGSLGMCEVAPGTYIYCGSALNGVKARVGRHFRRQKKVHWHIDRLLGVGEALFAFVIYSDRRCECDLAKGLLECDGVEKVLDDFGSSDCRCGGHLFRCDELNEKVLDEIRKMVIASSGP